MKRAAFYLVLTAMVTAGCAPAPVDLEPERQAVLQADRDFAQATAERGVEAWVSYFSEDGVMLPAAGDVVRGHAAIRDLMAPAFESPGYAIMWTPAFAEVAEGGDLAYTFGTYETSALDAAGNRTDTHGRYVTVWKKQADGNWKAVLDMGNSSPDDKE